MTCVVCAGTTFDIWGQQGMYSIFKCRSCGLGVTSPFLATEQIEEMNKKTYDGAQRAAVYFTREKEFENRYSGYLKRIKRFKGGGALLDIGCNIGMFMKVANQKGFAVTGVEMNPSCAAYGKEKFGFDIRASSLQDATFPDKEFDVVTIFDVLEHIPDMHGFLIEVNRILKAGGLLVAQSPNLDSFMAWLMRGNWSWLTPPDHLYHFTPRALESILKAHGFEVMVIRTWEPAADFSGNIFSSLPAGGLAGRIFRKLLRLMGIVLIFLLQRFWWEIQKGGLVEVYVIKTADN